ncbi:MAG: transcriptional regulator [Treponema sp.]|nr:transcriptional regulator [Treponema sp.]
MGTIGYKSKAESDFNVARVKATFSEIQHLMHADRNRLLSFHDVNDILKPRNQVYMGCQTVPIKLIVGSEGRYRDFNRYFLPKSDHLRSRWQRVDEAHLQDIILPSIQLYEIGGVYFVRDGNHRVSVAKAQHVEFIDAEVISLASEIIIKPGMTTDQLRDALIAYEKGIFYEKTKFGELTGDMSLDFTAPGRYDVIYNHILVHKYYINESNEEEIPFSDALVSWYGNVYSPAIAVIKKRWLLVNFPGRTESDMYVWIVKHWDFLKKKYGSYSFADAAGDFSRKYGQGQNNKKFFRFIAVLLDKMFGKRNRINIRKN